MTIETERDYRGSKEYQDEYDIIKDSLTVHSPSKSLNMDFILANIDDKDRAFIRTQIKVVNQIENFLGNDENAKKSAEKIRISLMTDVYALVVLSRTKGGRILTAILTGLIGNKDTKREMRSLREKLLGRHPGEPEERGL